MWQAIKDIWAVFVSMFVRRVRRGLPIEERLRQEQRKDRERHGRQKERFQRVGYAYDQMVKALARAQAIANNLTKRSKAELLAAQKEETAGNLDAAQMHYAAAAQYANQAAQQAQDVQQLEAEVGQMLKDKKHLKAQVITDYRRLVRRSRDDLVLIARYDIAKARNEALEIQEQMLEGLRDEDKDLRADVYQEVEEMEARVNARQEITSALLEEEAMATLSRELEVSDEGAQILEQIQGEIGYTPAREVTGKEELPAAEESKQASAGAE